MFVAFAVSTTTHVAFALSGGASRSVCMMHAFNIDSRGDQQLTQIARDRRLRAQSLQDSCTSGATVPFNALRRDRQHK